MIFIDTSIWVGYFREGNPRITENLNHALDQDLVALAAPVWIELLAGATRSESSRLKRLLSALPRYYPSHQTWNRIEEWIGKGLTVGHRFGAMDLLIASIAADQGSPVWSLDKDFGRMYHLGLIEIYRP